MTSPDTTADTVALPQELVAALENWARQCIAGPRASLAQAEEELAGARQSQADLEAELAELKAALEERDDQITRLSGELRNFRSIAADALVGKAKDQLAIEGKDAQIADLRQQLERSVAASAAVSDARLAAELELVGATTARDNYAAEVAELRQQLDSALAARRAV